MTSHDIHFNAPPASSGALPQVAILPLTPPSLQPRGYQSVGLAIFILAHSPPRKAAEGTHVIQLQHPSPSHLCRPRPGANPPPLQCKAGEVRLHR